MSGKPYRLIGFDIKMRLCWSWPFARIWIGKVWKIQTDPKGFRTELAP